MRTHAELLKRIAATCENNPEATAYVIGWFGAGASYEDLVGLVDALWELERAVGPGGLTGLLSERFGEAARNRT